MSKQEKEQLAHGIDMIVNAICRHAGSSSPSKHHFNAGTLDWIARCLRDGMTLEDAVEDAWRYLDY